MSQLEQLIVKSKSQGLVTEILNQPLNQDIPLEIVQLWNQQEISLWKKLFSPKPVVTGSFPIPEDKFKFYWDSKAALSKAGTYPSKLRHPDDPVILFSNASSVKNHVINNEGWLIINSGGGNGRIYLELYEIPEFKTLPQFKRNLVLMTTFKMSPNAANLSIKYGNHGTTGFLYNSKRFFGGFGQHAEPDVFGAKVEGNHNGNPANGKPYDFDYPNNLELKYSEEYKLFTIYTTDEPKNIMNVKSWIMFDAQKWLQVANHDYKKDSKWDELMKQLPNKGLDTKEAQAGPANIDLFHVWLRANKKSVAVKDIFLGTIN